MKPDLACELVNQLKYETNATVHTLIMDEDSTTILHVRKALNHDVNKWSDIIHVRKHVTGSLYRIKQKHSILTAEKIRYIVGCFVCAVSQNKENPDGVKEAILNIVPHVFREHINCGKWCNKSYDNKQPLLSGNSQRRDLNEILIKI